MASLNKKTIYGEDDKILTANRQYNLEIDPNDFSNLAIGSLLVRHLYYRHAIEQPTKE